MTKRPQSANRLTEAVQHAVRTTVRSAGARNLLVACSGGPDSVCVLYALAHVARQEAWTVTVGHVQHRIRADDDVDVALVRDLAERLNLPFRCKTLDWQAVDTERAPSEAAMRVRRYQALASLAGIVDADVILTGHTLDDQAETVLLHLLRGAGLDGIRGMAQIAAVPIDDTATQCPTAHAAQPCRLVRPLLTMRHAEAIAYCTAHGLRFIDDSSNHDSAYTRNWLRRDVLPLLASRFGDVSVTLARSAAVLAEDAHYMHAQTEAALECSLRFASNDLIALDAAALRGQHLALQHRILRVLLRRLSGRAPRASDVEQLSQAVARSSSSCVTHVGSVACYVSDDTILLGAPHAVREDVLERARIRHPLFRGTERIVAGQPFEFPAPSGAVPQARLVIQLIEEANRDARPTDPGIMQPLRLPRNAELALRNRQPGDRFHPAGRPHGLRLQDYLTDRRVPALVRDWLPLLVVDGTIAWVLGYDVGAAFAATPESASHFAVVTQHER